MQISCYAWAFMSNHAHFLFRIGTAPLSRLMRRLLSSYVIGFNIRHRRLADRVAQVLEMEPDEVFSKGR